LVGVKGTKTELKHRAKNTLKTSKTVEHFLYLFYALTQGPL